MVFEAPTYEEYLKATNFARFKYKYGLIVSIIATLLLLFISIFLVVHIKELTTNPIGSIFDRFEIDFCSCFGEKNYYINRTDVAWIES